MPSLKSILWYSTKPKALVLKCIGFFYDKLHPEEPWISWKAVRFCEQHLNPFMEALEWGSGRSTLWFAKRVKKITSIEHHAGWHQTISGKIAAKNVHNIDYRHIDLDHPPTQPCVIDYDPLPKYVSVIENFADESLDLVIVDGHYRQTCAKYCQKKIKRDGYLLIDNSNWMPLSEWGVPADWEVVHRSFGFYGETTIWKKP